MAEAVASGETSTSVDANGTTWYKREPRVSFPIQVKWEITPALAREAKMLLRALDIGFEMTSTEIEETNKAGEIRIVKHLSSGVAAKMVDIEKK